MIKIHTIRLCAMLLPLMGALNAAQAQRVRNPVVVTASNTAQNQLLVYDSDGALLQTVPTGGQGGVSGNSGGIQASGNLAAVVNFGSQNVSLFERGNSGFTMKQLIPAASSPVSVAFGNGHLYILGTTKIESHWMYGASANSNPDGVVGLLLADGSAAQVGVLPGQLIITEKNNVIETVNLDPEGFVSGTATLVQGIPANVNAPFGLVTQGDDAYVTIAHANEISLVRKGAVLTTTGSGTESAPCWLTLVGPFLYSSNSPSMSVSRFAVYGRKIVQDAAEAAKFSGNPTDIASGAGMIAVIDGSGQVSHLSVFSVDEDGNMTLLNAETINSAANGVAIMGGE
jgi:hypothetical protein